MRNRLVRRIIRGFTESKIELAEVNFLPENLNEDTRFRNPITKYAQSAKKMINGCYSMVNSEIKILQEDSIYSRVKVICASHTGHSKKQRICNRYEGGSELRLFYS